MSDLFPAISIHETHHKCSHCQHKKWEQTKHVLELVVVEPIDEDGFTIADSVETEQLVEYLTDTLNEYEPGWLSPREGAHWFVRVIRPARY